MCFYVKLLQFLIAAVLSVVAVCSPAGEWSAEPRVKELIITAAAWERLQDEYRMLVAGGHLTHGQQQEFSRYLGELGFRISAQCREVLQRYPDIDRGPLPCSDMALAAGLPGDPASEQTPQEVVTSLDAALMDGLGEFDEMLLTEQQKITSRTPRSGGASGGGAGGEGGGAAEEGGSGDGNGGRGEGAGKGQGNGKPAQGGTQQEASPGKGEGGRGTGEGAGKSGTGRGAGGGGGKGGGAAPADIPDGKDDDVVARQLREAAMKEQDPELRRKLWDEYRRYKASTS